MLEYSDLHGYQKRAVEAINNQKNIALFMDMGLGKTISVLTALNCLFDEFAIAKVLIIAPLYVANNVWRQEMKQWSHVKGLDDECAMLTGDAKTRTLNMKSDKRIHIINKDNVKWLCEQKGRHWDYDSVIIDESSTFKSPSTQRFKSLKRVLPFINRMVLLTGTPTANGLLDIWSQMYLLDQGKALGKTMSAYKQTYFYPDYMGYKFTLRDGAQKRIAEQIKPLVLRLSAKDYLRMPKVHNNRIKITLPNKCQKQYKELEKEFILQLEGDEITAVNTAVLTGKLHQYANGALYTENKQFKEVHTTKLEALESVIEENDGSPILVAYNFKSDLVRLKKKFKTAVDIKEDGAIDKWNRGKVQLLLAHPASAGHGLNLQKGGNIVVWFSLTWSLELYQQFNARLYRQGQQKPVFIHHIIADKTIDPVIIGALSGKHKTQKELLAQVKENILSIGTG